MLGYTVVEKNGRVRDAPRDELAGGDLLDQHAPDQYACEVAERAVASPVRKVSS
jgi:hypothetical protein